MSIVKGIIKLSITEQIIKHKKIVVGFFAIAAIISIITATKVSVNYNMQDYLPSDAQSTVALSIIDNEFTQATPNARVMITDVTLTEALEYKAKLKAIKGVAEVLWLDDAIDIHQPIEYADKKTVEGYYKDSKALFLITITEGAEGIASDAIYELIGDQNALAGAAVDMAVTQALSLSESLSAMAILIPLIIVFLIISTSSWLEPVLFLLTIGISVIINMGTNIFLGEISFVTQAISPILQMAVSLDYTIFLLHSFEANREKTADVNSAMKLAVKQSFPAVAASAATTLFGFAALIFMRFRIGSDLGINLLKGIVLSYISVMVFLPALTLLSYKLIDKTRHKRLLPEFKSIGKLVKALCVPCFVLVLVIIAPVFLAQKNNTFIYGTSSVASGSRAGLDEAKISETFESTISIVLLVPKGEPAKEALLSSELQKLSQIVSVIAYAKNVGNTIPNEYLDNDITNQFYSTNYSRFILSANTNEEGREAFEVVEAVRAKAGEYYGSNIYTCGQSANLYDMKTIVSEDANIVNLIAVILIGLVLLVTFKSITMPLLLLFVIEAAIWINLSYPYFTGNVLCYIGYLVVSTVQLGATVDYAILLSHDYAQNRTFMDKKEALKATLNFNFSSILISASILASAGFCLGFTSTNQIVSEMGLLLGRGTLLSAALVIFVLPALLLIFDGLIAKTTLHSNFVRRSQP